MYHLEEHQAAELVKHAVPLPQESRLLVLRSRILVGHVNLPELLRDELLDLLVALNDETQGWELTRSVADDTRPVDDIAKAECLESGESCTYPQVDLLSHADSVCKVLVWRLQIVSRTLDVLHCQG